MSDEQRYTLAQAEREIERRACEAGGHEPVTFDRTFEAAVAKRAWCRCGAITWTWAPS